MFNRYKKKPDWELNLIVHELLKEKQTKYVVRQLRKIHKVQDDRRNALLKEWSY
jgi:hypothetical protein